MRGSGIAFSWSALAALGLIATAFVGLISIQAYGIDLAAASREDIERFVAGLGPWGPFGSIALMVLHSVTPLPAEVIALANGMLFGPVWGAVLTWSGAMLGATLYFTASRWLGQPFLRRVLPGEALERVRRAARNPGALLAARLIPLISFNVINYAAGSLGVAWWPFLWTTALGILPLTIAMVFLGNGVLDVPWWATLGLVSSAALLTFGWRKVRHA